jgi:1,4-alpha-glucan branching enzyme
MTLAKLPTPLLDNNNDLKRISEARHHDPFSILGSVCDMQGKHRQNYYVYRPSAEKLFLSHKGKLTALTRVKNSDFFYSADDSTNWPAHPHLHEINKKGESHEFIDPYSFEALLNEGDLTRYNQDSHWQSYLFLGAHHHSHHDIDGILFAVWAPNAERVSVIGDFNDWDGRVHPMRCRGASGIWELFIPQLADSTLYKYEIRNQKTGEILVKADPYARFYEFRPSTASRLQPESKYAWQDTLWMKQRAQRQWLHEPMSIYEVHLGSWRRDANGNYLSYREIARQLADYVNANNFTHIELLPITEYPFDGSWGYQATGYFAPTSRFGSPEDFKYFIDYFHRHNIGVILDWVPAHFPRDEHALARFDGTALYEHADPRLGEHKDWDTLIFNFGRTEVANFLLSSAYFWLNEYHIDGLRVDAVASMLYLDYSRKPDEWLPNRYNSNENLEAIEFLRSLNCILHEHCPGALVIAEESTSWPQVSRPVFLGGLGFSMKWNMGWMNDILDYFQQDPVHRKYYHNDLTFGLLYAFTENFVLPFSHDEVVHGKRSILEKMPGDTWQKFANVRLLYTFMFAYPGKKLLFMGNEFAQGREWCHDRQLDWDLLQHPFQQGVQHLVRDLGTIYKTDPALHQYDFSSTGFRWVDCHDSAQSVICFTRHSDNEFILVVLNFTPIPRHNYRIGVPQAGVYQEILNSDSEYYAGSNVFNGTHIASEARAMMGHEQSIVLTLPPLAGLLLKLKAD